MNINLILVRSNTFIGKQIRRITGSYYNHIGIFLNDVEIIEAISASGVIITSYEKYQKLKQKNKLDFDIYTLKQPISSEEWNIVESYLREQIGRKYDIMQFLSLLFFFIFHINRTVNPIDIEKAFICSELVGKACSKINIFFNNKIELDNLTPKDIEDSEIIEKVIL